MSDPVNHPSHYKAGGLEAIDVIEAFDLDKDFLLGNVAKYLLRSGRKGAALTDLQKARWYLDRKIRALGGEASAAPVATGLCYLATPYSKYPDGLESAFKLAAHLAGHLLKAGITAYCPIAHMHPVAVHGEIDPLDHDIWLPSDEVMMARCDTLLVATMRGWRQSKGIAHEIEVFRAAGKPMLYLDPDALTITASEPTAEVSA
ncbi:MAG TPA: DUF1937 family protein [Xanthobacteraceae bacterium]|nr:DUF1937 family protein [Xanthobacteraceae bacterium]